MMKALFTAFLFNLIFLTIESAKSATGRNKKCIVGFNKLGFVINNTCSMGDMCVLFRDGWFCVEIDRSYFSINIRELNISKRPTEDSFCKTMLCQYGSVCRCSQVKCASHLTGIYCGDPINYCINHNCKHGAKCLPRLGGYNCLCTINYIGRYCEYPTPHHLNSFSIMKRPDFVFDIIQSTSLEYSHIFLSQDMGLLPKVTVDFGDGTLMQKRTFVVLKNATKVLTQLFRLAVSFKSDKLEVIIFNHTYKNGGLYNVEVNGWNGYFHIFHTVYQINVVAVKACLLKVILYNTKDPKIIAKFYRKTAIWIPTAISSNCMKVNLENLWKLYQVNECADSASPEKLYVNHQIRVNVPNLYIPPFTMDYGHYLACISVTITKPVSTSKQVCTCFQVLRDALVAHIQDGTRVSRLINKMFHLDASLSFDPNFPRDRQPLLVYSWTCTPKSKFCNENLPLNETGPILVVPTGALQEKQYNFTVMVDYVAVSTEGTYTGIAKQEIQIMKTAVCLYFINCTKNCVGGVVNPEKLTVMTAVVECKSTIEKFNFQFCLKTANRRKEQIPFNDADFYRESNEMIIYKDQFKPNMRYILKFTLVDLSNSSSLIQAGKPCEVSLITSKSIPAELCNLNPSHGVAALTIFTINCPKSLLGDPFPIVYEIEQIIYLDYPKNRRILYSYSLTGCNVGVTLGPGILKYDYLTYVQVSITYNNGITSNSISNVTVYPLYYFSPNPRDIWSYISMMINGKISFLSISLENENEYDVVQHIISIAASVKHIHEHVNFNQTNFPIDKLRNYLINCLIDVPISNIYNVRFVMSALNTIMSIPLQKKLLWSPDIVNAIAFMETMLKKLKNYLAREEQIFSQQQIDKIYMDFLDIASDIIKLPSPEFRIFREDLVELVSVINRYTEVHNLNPYDISSKALSHYNSHLVMNLLCAMMGTYINTFQPTSMRPSVITSNGLSLIMQKHMPQYVSSKSLSISKRANIAIKFNASLHRTVRNLHFKILVMDTNPDWYSCKSDINYTFPYVKVLVSDRTNASHVIPVEVDFHPIESSLPNDTSSVYQGNLPIKPFWKFKDQDLHFHKIILGKGGKLLVKFEPLQNSIKIMVVLKKYMKPTIADIWEHGIVIPQQVEEGWSILVDDPIQDDLTLYYMGVFMEINAIKKITKDKTLRVFDDFEYEDENLTRERKKRSVDQKNVREIKIDYKFSVYSVYCLSYKEIKKHWTWKNCDVKFVSSSQVIRCRCYTNDVLTANLKAAMVDNTDPPEYDVIIKFHDNPIILFTITFIFLLFVGLFKWTLEQDRKDMLRRTVCFLVDNYPDYFYTYLTIVYTGRNVKAGTTSNITIELEGTLATSLPHVLKDWAGPVLARGSQDWFVIKTKKPLGEIFCLHMWADFSGEKPDWFCDKVIVHDIQCQKIWFFVIKQWFDPLMGDGSMSFTTFQASEEMIFSSSHYFEEIMERELDAGMHGWLSIFYRYPYNNYTRTQRAGVAVAHLCMIMQILIYYYGFVQLDEPQYQIYNSANYDFNWQDLYKAFMAALIAFPIHLLLVWFFRSIKPSSRWIGAPTDRSLSRFDIESADSYDIMWISSEMKSMSSRIRVKNRQFKESDDNKYISSAQSPNIFKSEEFESDQDLKHVPRDRRNSDRSASTISSTKNDNVVPLRRLSTPYETESTFTNESTKSFESPKYSTNREKSVPKSYFFEPFYSYIAWIVLLTISIPCIYSIILNGVVYGWVASLHYLTSLFFAILISVFVLETLKWFFWSTFLFFRGRHVYAFEDRTDLVNTLEPEYKIPESLKARITRKVNKLRENLIYEPLLENVVEKIKKNRISSFLTRIMISKCLILFLFTLLQVMIATTIYIPDGYLHIRNLKNLVQQSENTHANLARQVQSKEDLIKYLETALIPNLQNDETGENSSTLTSSRDNVNYLIGVMRLRQVRKDPRTCNIDTAPWRANCPSIYDTQNYTVGWNNISEEAFLDNVIFAWYGAFRNAWLYENNPVILRNTVTYQNKSRFPLGAYEIHLARNKNGSLEIIDYLKKNHWFDDLTAVVYIDFVLFNPTIYALSEVSIMAERTDQGLYYISGNYIYDVIHPSQTYGQMYLLIYLVIAFIWLVMYIYTKSQYYTLIKAKQYLSPKFGLKRKMFLLLAFVSIILHIFKTVYLEYFNGIIQNANENEYMSIGLLIFLGRCLSITLTLSLILIVIELFSIFNTIIKFKFIITLFTQAVKTIFFFFIFYFIIMMAFNWIYYMNMGTYSYHYRSFLIGIINEFVIVAKNTNFRLFSRQAPSIIVSILVYFTYAVSLVCVWQSFATAIIISVYSTVKRNQRKNVKFRHTSVLTSYAQKHFNSIDGKSNRKEQRIENFFLRTIPRLKIMGYLVVDWHYQNVKKPKPSKNYRHEAMKIVILEELKKMNYFIEEDEKYPQNRENELLNNYIMHKVMRAVVLRSVMKKQLHHLNKNMNVLFRHNMYK